MNHLGRFSGLTSQSQKIAVRGQDGVVIRSCPVPDLPILRPANTGVAHMGDSREQMRQQRNQPQRQILVQQQA